MEDCDIEPILSGHNLIDGFRKLYKEQWPESCDIHIKCQNGVMVPASKLLLKVSSVYFQAYFRQQPDSQLVDLSDFDSGIVTLAIKSIIAPNLKEIEGCVMDLVKVADYLQMDDLLMIGSKVLAMKLSEENILAIIDLNCSVQVPTLTGALINFLQKNIQFGFAIQAISKLPEEHFNSLFIPKADLVLCDSYGRNYDLVEKLVILAKGYYDSLKFMNKLDSFNFIGLYTKGLHQAHVTVNTVRLLWMLHWIFQSDYDIAKSRLTNLRPGLCSVPLHPEVHDLIKKQLDNACDLPHMPPKYDVDEPNVVHRHLRSGHLQMRFGPFGNTPDGLIEGQKTKWSIEGNIRKIKVKTRTWGHFGIVQGIQVFLDDGTSQAFGMDLDDTDRVKSLVVPEGQYIKTMNFKSAAFIQAIEIETNKGQIVGWAGGTVGSLSSPFKSLRGMHHYLRGISGSTVMTDNAPCICHIELCHDVIYQPSANKDLFDNDPDFHDIESDED